jgi:hypothetical protein
MAFLLFGVLLLIIRPPLNLLLGTRRNQLANLFAEANRLTSFPILHNIQSTVEWQFIPASRISALSSGEFVGMVADSPDQPVELKAFCCRLVNDPAALTEETKNYKKLAVIREVTQQMLLDNFHQVRSEVAALIRSEMDRITNARAAASIVGVKRPSPSGPIK